MTTLTTGMLAEQHELTSSNLIQFLKIYIPTDSDPVVQRFCASQTLEWDGQTWPKAAFSLTGIGEKGTSERVRPKLVIPNPDGIYSYYVGNGFLEGSQVTYYQVHPDDLETSQSQTQYYFINRVTEMNRRYINCQLSSFSDGNSFKLPSKRFIQPEFNQVRL